MSPSSMEPRAVARDLRLGLGEARRDEAWCGGGRTTEHEAEPRAGQRRLELGKLGCVRCLLVRPAGRRRAPLPIILGPI